jgi:hypothetical protein
MSEMSLRVTLNASPILSKEELVITYYQDAIQGMETSFIF